MLLTFAFKSREGIYYVASLAYPVLRRHIRLCLLLIVFIRVVTCEASIVSETHKHAAFRTLEFKRLATLILLGRER